MLARLLGVTYTSIPRPYDRESNTGKRRLLN